MVLAWRDVRSYGNVRINGMLASRTSYFPLLLALAAACHAQSVITTIAGVDPVFNGSGSPAINVPIGYVNGVVDGSGNAYFTDPLEHLVLRVSSTGILSVVAGNGIAGYSGDGGPATAAAIAATDPTATIQSGLRPGSESGGSRWTSRATFFSATGIACAWFPRAGLSNTVAGGGANNGNAAMPATSTALGYRGRDGLR